MEGGGGAEEKGGREKEAEAEAEEVVAMVGDKSWKGGDEGRKKGRKEERRNEIFSRKGAKEENFLKGAFSFGETGRRGERGGGGKGKHWLRCHSLLSLRPSRMACSLCNKHGSLFWTGIQGEGRGGEGEGCSNGRMRSART